MGEGREPSLLSVSIAGNIVVAALVRGIYVGRARELSVRVIMCQWYKGHQLGNIPWQSRRQSPSLHWYLSGDLVNSVLSDCQAAVAPYMYTPLDTYLMMMEFFPPGDRAVTVSLGGRCNPGRAHQIVASICQSGGVCG